MAERPKVLLIITQDTKGEEARYLRARLEGKVTTDHDTARRLFTLICVLHIKASTTAVDSHGGGHASHAA